jgi:hypothetical protein
MRKHWTGEEYRNTQGRVWVYQPDHPLALSNGYVKRAIVIWEKANGQPFPKGKLAHHDNEIKDDDRPENIIPMTRSEHARHHRLGKRYPNGYKRRD